MKEKLNNFMNIDTKMKKIDALVSELDTEVQKICTDKKCSLKPIKKSKKNSKALIIKSNT